MVPRFTGFWCLKAAPPLHVTSLWDLMTLRGTLEIIPSLEVLWDVWQTESGMAVLSWMDTLTRCHRTDHPIAFMEGSKVSLCVLRSLFIRSSFIFNFFISLLQVDVEQQKAEMSLTTTLYVGNLSFHTSEEQIYEVFSKVGEVKRVVMGLDRIRKTPCGFCFVE